MTAYARGKYSKAACDRCGQVYKYGTLKPEFKNGKRTGLLTCTECWDGEHPQDRPPRPYPDPQALLHARPRSEKNAVGDSHPVKNAFAPPNGEAYEDWVKEQL
jgi:hypothetical protein